MRTSLRITSALIALALPIAATAAMANVTGIRATKEGSDVHVSWDKPEGDAAYYRIFYSHQSILGNDGLFDDFDIADAADTEHTLTNLPASDELFVSVLAVNTMGEESEQFLEEARVEMGAMTATNSMEGETASTAASAETQSATAGAELRLLAVDALSSTGILLTFSHPVNIPRERAAEAFTVVASGTTLGLARLILDENRVTIHTAPQVAGRVYVVAVSDIVTGRLPTGQTTLLDPAQTSVFFQGFGAATSAASSVAASMPGEVRDLRLRAQPQNDRKYTVEVSWQAPAGAASFIVEQTTDRGRTYGSAQTVPATSNGVRIAGIPAGVSFGVRVKTVAADGKKTQGIMQFIDLPAPEPVPGTGGTPPKSDELPNSGLPLVLLIPASGAIAGFLRMRSKRMPARA